MRPLAHVAGTAAAIVGMVPGVLGALIGAFIDHQFNGTITPLAIAFVVGNVVAIAGWRWASVRVALSRYRRLAVRHERGLAEPVGADVTVRSVDRLVVHGRRVAVEVEHAGRTEVPARHDGVGPEVAAALVVDVPAHRLVARITGEVVGRVDLDAVAVGVADVEVERVRHAVAAGATFDVTDLRRVRRSCRTG